MPYRAPVKDIRFILDHVVGFAEVAATPRFAEATPDLAEAILTEAGRLSTDILAPLNSARVELQADRVLGLGPDCRVEFVHVRCLPQQCHRVVAVRLARVGA